LNNAGSQENIREEYASKKGGRGGADGKKKHSAEYLSKGKTGAKNARPGGGEKKERTTRVGTSGREKRNSNELGGLKS